MGQLEEEEDGNITQDAERGYGIAHEDTVDDKDVDPGYQDILDDEEEEIEAREKPWYRREVPLFYMILTGIVSSVIGGFVIDYVHTRKHKHEEQSLSNKELIMLLVQLLNSKSDRAVVVPKEEVKKETHTGPDWMQKIGNSYDVKDDRVAKMNEMCISEMYKVKRNMFGDVLDVYMTDSWIK